ncbi:transcriptional regulator [Streptomyces sp. SP18CS02]|uniref:transcriptional regulator n=1 Tax=Streptomyces sp. SP18CS02 TaxID=3002531 RepID=UPI002E774E82|nr:transcriptional regulator [Streptomyces sp. SP18CS02]MEE1753759.1 transcriptional regulator [Streptomyces sp. SP18CS02]
MTGDRGGPPGGSQPPIGQPAGATPAARALKELVHRLHTEAGAPSAAYIAASVTRDRAPRPGLSKESVRGIIGSSGPTAGQADLVSVATVLARKARWDVADVARRVRDLWVAARLTPRLGVPVRDLDPFALEVHQAITLPGQGALPTLPSYVEREHDRQLHRIMDRAAAGESLLVTLIGESSTGKTRACWEALRRLPAGWRVWHPYDPTRPEAALGHLADVGPRTVIWLNEAQHYLLAPEARTAERITAGLRTLLRDPGRAPVLVLATMWPRFWEPLTVLSASATQDSFAQQRELLTGVGLRLPVPKSFTSADIDSAHREARRDPRLARALEGAADGEVTQFLAGVPALRDHYRYAPPGAAALIRAAMDFRRLGHGRALPHALLAGAVEDYLTDRELDSLGEGWLESALEYCAEPCRGVPGPLTRVRRRGERLATVAYRLADYLEQHGNAERRLNCPPRSFWESAARHAAHGEDLLALAHAAEVRGRLRHAADLFRAATEAGNTGALPELARLRERTGDTGGARELYEASYEADHTVRRELVRLRERDGDREGAERLAFEAADTGDTELLADLARLRQEAGDKESAERLVSTAARQGKIQTFPELARSREAAGDGAGAEELAFAALRAGYTYALAELVRIRHGQGDGGGAERLVVAAARAGRVRPAARMARLLEQSGDTAGAERLLRVAADAGSRFALTELARLRTRAGDRPGAKSLLGTAAEAGSTFAMTQLGRLRDRAGDTGGAEELYRAAADRGNTDALAALALLRELAGDSKEAERMACEAADGGSTFALAELVWVRETARASQQAESLARTATRAGNTGALVLLARLREQAGDKAGAERLVGLAALGGNSLVLNEFVRLREESGDKQGAERLALAGTSRVVAGLAHLREEAGEIRDAERLFLKAVALGETRALTELARLREEAGDREGAEATARSAAHAGHVDALAVTARLRARSGSVEDARRLYRSAADAGYGSALDELAAALRRTGHAEWEDLRRYGLEADGTPAKAW